jgi:hypothetical protein
MSSQSIPNLANTQNLKPFMKHGWQFSLVTKNNNQVKPLIHKIITSVCQVYIKKLLPKGYF